MFKNWPQSGQRIRLSYINVIDLRRRNKEEHLYIKHSETCTLHLTHLEGAVMTIVSMKIRSDVKGEKVLVKMCLLNYSFTWIFEFHFAEWCLCRVWHNKVMMCKDFIVIAQCAKHFQCNSSVVIHIKTPAHGKWPVTFMCSFNFFLVYCISWLAQSI